MGSPDNAYPVQIGFYSPENTVTAQVVAAQLTGRLVIVTWN